MSEAAIIALTPLVIQAIEIVGPQIVAALNPQVFTDVQWQQIQAAADAAIAKAKADAEAMP